jgi:large repetitive protein
MNQAAYDKTTNRITVTLLTGATVNDVAAAINTLGVNFSATGVVNGGAAVNALDLGIRTVGLSNWALNPKRDQIRVYFNDDDFYATKVKTGDVAPNPTVVDPAFYQLILTRDTVQPGDDVLIPSSEVQSIEYDPALNLATITYKQPIDQLAGAGTYRLRIGGRDAVANQSAPQTITPTNITADPAGDFANAPTIGTLINSTSMVINQQIITTSAADLPLDFPGSNFEPGHRDIQDESHVGGGDGSPQIATTAYNFALNRSYGLDAAGRPVSTTITPEQIARVREIFEFYSMQLGIDFVETESAGLTIVVGDLFPLGGTQSGPGDVAGIAGGGLAIMDGAETWDNSFGAGFFSVAMHEIGHLLGLGHTYDLPPGTIMGSEGDLSSNPTLPSEWVFPGDADVVHGQFLYRPDNRDVDSYSFVVPTGSSGTFTAETFAERLSNSSNLDTYLTLLKQTANGYEVIAINNDSNSSDSFLSVNLTEGTYFLSVTGKGNENFNPLIQNTGDGAVSQGNYQLRINFTKLDGDGDAQAGGNFNFWFRAAPPADLAPVGTPKTIYVDKGYAGPTFTGSAASPMNSLDLNNPVKWPVGFVQPNDIIRVVGSQGADRLLATPADNPAYEVGRGGVGNVVLSDGLTLEVPQGVTMMVDAGAIFKLRNTRIAAGSLDAGINKSFSSLQVLGTPRQTANFTSYNDQSQGTDTNPIVTNPQAGDWGGLDFHNDIDRQEGRGDFERKGIFLNHVAFADIRYGGGQITVVSPSPTINPINLNQARPTLLNNIIRFSADAAISADPDSFEETRFTEPRYQIAQLFNPDYDRVGPVIRGNMLTSNTANGLFVRTSTFAGGPLTELTTSARWDDTDITYVIGENLIIAGTPGGSYLETVAPDVSLVQNFDATGGSLVIGQTVTYKLDFIDKFGGVSIPSAATVAKTLTSNALRLANLPTASQDFVGRRLFRSNDGGATFRLIAELDGDTTSYTDVGGDLSAVLVNPTATSLQRARPDARLQVDPGVVVKLTGARIEVGISAQLIAEGSSDRKVVFTSRADDRYGAAGTFDTNGNGTATSAGAGDWGGLVARHLSSISIDNAYIAFGGGVTSVSGGFAGFNAIEIQQADGRVTNSVIENNASGLGGNLFTRDGRGPHDASVIFVAGSQPVIGNNIIRNNSISNTAVISVNANAMNTDNVQDRGRQTGNVEKIGAGLGNSGPLVDGNLLLGNGLNGMRVRGQTQTTGTVWDDTDMVHILQSEVVVPDLHTYGGLRLQSKVDESLVVKLGAGAGITALGRPLDITDRIGGSVQILGTPGFPVVMTSLSDDSVGAGFDPNGSELVDTNNNRNATVANAGDWRSIKLEPYTNDRNLDTVLELEADQIQDVGINDLTTTAQQVGALAGALNGGDENLRLGFTMHGTIAAPQDLDVYSFIGNAGTTIWLDIDQSNGSLDSVVELLDSSGRIIAQSNNSLQESANPSLLFVTSDTSKITREKVNPLEVDPFITTQDLYTVNPLDAGMRITGNRWWCQYLLRTGSKQQFEAWGFRHQPAESSPRSHGTLVWSLPVAGSYAAER